MKIISDIRLFEPSESQKLTYLPNIELSLGCHRVAMKLREDAFSLGEFDHLYLGFTSSFPAGSFTLEEEIDKFHPWYRYVYVGVTQEELSAIEVSKNTAYMFGVLERILSELFCKKMDDTTVVRNAIEEAKKGPEMLMRFKEKKSSNAAAIIYLRLLDNAHYLPLLCVTDLGGNEILRKDLPETIDLGIIGEIQLSSKKVTVKPRKNAFTKALQPISFELK